VDEMTPILDMGKRVETGIRLLKQNLQAIIILTGGKTAGPISEAMMMSLIAYSRGVPAGKVLLEEDSRSTVENAQLTALLVQKLSIKKFVLVSRISHLKRAMPIFKSHLEFEQVQSEPTDITKEQIKENLEEYLTYKPSVRVTHLLNKILKEFHDNGL
ncbi:MAG: YdcF family protein, partial [Candidatus Omnitrophota bacterium]